MLVKGATGSQSGKSITKQTKYTDICVWLVVDYTNVAYHLEVILGTTLPDLSPL